MPSLERSLFGRLPDGRAVEKVTLGGEGGFSASFLTLGATLQALMVPDRQGRLADVVLGFSSVEAVLADGCYLGATIGRYANRIGGAAFSLDGETFSLPANNGGNCLHGGAEGFNRALWEIAHLGPDADGSVSLHLTHESPDGDQGFPGAVSVRAVFSVKGRTLSVRLEATTTRPTPVSLSFHPYFNLEGEGLNLDHVVRIAASAYLPTDEKGLPLSPQDVTGGPFDFRQPKRLGDDIDADHPQIRKAQGYDHCMILDRGEDVAEVASPKSGRRLRLSTNQRGLQLYSAAFLGDGPQDKTGAVPRPRSGLCLEPQAFPDSPNRPDFPSAVLRPGETYLNRMRFKFDPAP